MDSEIRASKKDIEEWLKLLLTKTELTTPKIVFEGTADKGDNYMSDITFIRIEAIKDQKKITKKLVVKCSQKSNELREAMPIAQSFANEIFVYETLMPFFEKFQKDKNVTIPFDNYPKLFGTLTFENMEVIALEDLRQDHYVLWDRKRPMPLSHIEEIMKIYGRFHALSFALRDQKYDLLIQMGGNLQDVMKEFADASRKTDIDDLDMIRNMIEVAEDVGDSKCVEKIKLLIGKFDESIEKIKPENPFVVLTHGDCWNNNFMFKYVNEEHKEISKVCLLDWQICYWGSPVYDLSYFLFTCLSNSEMDRFDDLNKTYYDSLCINLKELGSDPEKLFPYQEFLNQWNEFGFFGLIMMSSVLTLCLSEKEEIPDAEKMENKGDFMKTFFFNVKNQSEYSKRTLAAMRLAIQRGFV